MKPEDQAINPSNGEVKDDNKPEIKHVNKTSTKEDTFFNRSLRKIGFALLFLFIGALAVSLTLYLPTNSKLQAAQSELERLSPMEAEYEELKITAENLSIHSAVYKILGNASMMRIALVDIDTNRVNQYIRYIEDDLADMEILDYPDLPVSLSNQFAKVTAKITSDRMGSLDELQSFQNDLLLLIDNLK